MIKVAFPAKDLQRWFEMRQLLASTLYELPATSGFTTLRIV